MKKVKSKIKYFGNMAALVTAAFLMVLGFASIPAVAPGAIQLPWNPGWDVCANSPGPVCTSPALGVLNINNQLDFATSKVIYTQPPGQPHDLHITYILNGALPNENYPVGFHLFWPSTSSCISSFGTIGGNPLIPSNCDVATRQGNTRVFEVFELGTLITDSTGVGSLAATIQNIPSGTYELEYHVRSCGSCIGVPFSDVIFQSPGPQYGNPATDVYITIP